MLQEKTEREKQFQVIPKRRKRCGGFTLIEIVAVTAMLGILAAMVMPSVEGANERAKNAKLKSDLATVDNAIQLYKMEKGVYPVNLNELQPGYIAKGKEFKDAKNEGLQYKRSDGNDYKLSGMKVDGTLTLSDGSTETAAKTEGTGTEANGGGV